jgi:hypothetical protein
VLLLEVLLRRAHELIEGVLARELGYEVDREVGSVQSWSGGNDAGRVYLLDEAAGITSLREQLLAERVIVQQSLDGGRQLLIIESASCFMPSIYANRAPFQEVDP